MAKRKAAKPKANKCKKGWVPVEIYLGKKKTLIVCGRVVTEERKKSGSDWFFGTTGALDMLAAIASGLSHSH